jgi:hypothetical protein
MLKASKVFVVSLLLVVITGVFFTVRSSPVKPQVVTATADVVVEDPFKGVVFYKNPLSGGLAMYFAFELEPNHEYSWQITSDGVNWEEIQHLSTKGYTHEVYESFNIPDPCNGIWPRIIDLGASPL